MCMVVYIASRSPLPLVPWGDDAPAFNVTALTEHEERVRSHFSLPHVRYAGSHTHCGCGFNEGRHPDADPQERIAALASSAMLARFVREHRVEQVYSCWSVDEGEPQEFARRIVPAALVADDFVLRERELLTIENDAP
jgi:hypothetical protein